MEVSKESYDLYISLALNKGEYDEYCKLATVQANLVKMIKNAKLESMNSAVSLPSKVHKKIQDRYSQSEMLEEYEVKTVMNEDAMNKFKIEKD